MRRERLVLAILLLATVLVWGAVWQETNRALTITVLDVGQGDAILVQAPSGRTMLIDGGGRAGEDTRGYDVGREVVVPALMARGVRSIDVLLITHPHEDHIGGLPAVLDAVPVKMVLDPMLPSESETYQELRREIQRRHLPLHRATDGQRINLGGGVHVDVLNPPDPRLGSESPANDNSVVLRLTQGEVSVLLAADVDEAGARRLAQMGDRVRSTILKVPHHGSPAAAATGFFPAVRPELAIISVGKNNPFGHPAPEVLRELAGLGAKVMRTDEEGAITVRVRSGRWWAWGHLGGPGRRHTGGREEVKEAAWAGMRG